MYALNCAIQIGNLPVFDFVHEVKIESTWKKFTDTCTITLPRKILISKAGISTRLQDLISVGDKVVVRYGYDGELRQEFAGFVAELKPGTPFEIRCEDAMWLFKRGSMSKAWRSVELRELLRYVLDFYGLDYPIQELGSLTLGKYTIAKATGAQVFDSLKKQFGISCFFRNGTLVAGDPYQAGKSATRHKYGFRQNIIDAEELVFTAAQDVALHFRGISYQKDGKKIVVDESGYVQNGTIKLAKGAPKVEKPNATGLGGGIGKGELRTITAVNLNEEQLRAFVRQEAQRLRYSGYRGSLLSFGVPAAEHGDIAVISDPDYPERAGEYFIDGVSKTFGVGGSRRKLLIGPLAV
jgi:hypothetical protein